jgi:serine/threonine-protein kinase
MTTTCTRCGAHYADDADRCPVDGAHLHSTEVLALIGLRFEGYEVLSVLGEGGMGVVYKGRHLMLDKTVAIKILHPKLAGYREAVEQFIREAQAATRIQHPHIVDVTDCGTGPGGVPFFVMEHLEGEGLDQVLARGSPFDVFRAVNIVNQVARVLEVAHEAGIVHRDLKPENVFLLRKDGKRQVVERVRQGAESRFVVREEGQYDYVKLLDFGVAKVIGQAPSSATRAGQIFGTPHYVSPEQARGLSVDGRSDIYSLGVLFYRLVTGALPVDGQTVLDILNGHVSGSVIPPRLRDPALFIDEATDAVVMRCLEKDPTCRFQTMGELCDALQGCFTDRVFLRFADRLPGAREAGIVPPPAPRHPMKCAPVRQITRSLADRGRPLASPAEPTAQPHRGVTERASPSPMPYAPPLPTPSTTVALEGPGRKRPQRITALTVAVALAGGSIAVALLMPTPRRQLEVPVSSSGPASAKTLKPGLAREPGRRPLATADSGVDHGRPGGPRGAVQSSRTGRSAELERTVDPGSR